MTTSRSSLPWGALAVIGALSILAGVLLMFWSEPSLLAVALIVGFDLLALGCVQLFNAFFSPVTDGRRVSTAIVAGVEVVAGLVVIARPGGSLQVVAIALGACLVLTGAFLLLALGEVDHRGPLVMRAAADIVIGGVLVIWPEFGLKTFAVVAGIGFVVRGIVTLLAAWAEHHEPAAPTTPRLA
jgi:uncharacterized membrane protein HdeD (DUF308 family)